MLDYRKNPINNVFFLLMITFHSLSEVYLSLSLSLIVPKLSPKPSLTTDGQVSSPASVSSSVDPSSQLAQTDGPAPSQEDIKMEVKKQEDEEEEDIDSQDEDKGKTGKGQPELKTEEKPEVRLLMLIYYQ